MLSIERLYVTITERCNMLCPHCWVTAGEKSLTYKEITVDEIRDTIDRLLTIGLKRVKLTGGEPMVRKQDTFSVIEYCFQKGLGVTIETNASLLDEKDISRLRSLPSLEIGVSLDYPDSRFDDFRRKKGAFELVTHAIQTLSKTHKVVVAMVVTKDNQHLIEETAKVIVDHGGIPRFLLCMPGGRASEGEESILLSTDEMFKYFAKVEEVRKALSGRVSLSLPFAFLSTEGILGAGKCEPDKVIGLLPDGSVSLCGIGIGNKDMVYGSIRTDDIIHIIGDSEALQEIRRLANHEREFEGVCNMCLFRNACAPLCPAHSKAVLGSYNCSFPVCQEIYSAGKFPAELIVKE